MSMLHHHRRAPQPRAGLAEFRAEPAAGCGVELATPNGAAVGPAILVLARWWVAGDPPTSRVHIREERNCQVIIR